MRVVVEWKYADSRRSGSGWRALGLMLLLIQTRTQTPSVNDCTTFPKMSTYSLTLSPRKLKTSRPSSSFSIPLLRGLAYWPAIRPILTTGRRPPQIRMREKLRIKPIFAVIFSCGQIDPKYGGERQIGVSRFVSSLLYES